MIVLTIAAIVGAAIGAFYGIDGMPGQWTKNLTGRLGMNDDGQVFGLTDRAVQAWLY